MNDDDIEVDNILFRREPDAFDRAWHADLWHPANIKALASPPPRKPRKPTLAGALKEADRAGKPVRGAVIAPSGEFTLQFGEPEAALSSNTDDEVEAWFKKHARN